MVARDNGGEDQERHAQHWPDGQQVREAGDGVGEGNHTQHLRNFVVAGAEGVRQDGEGEGQDTAVAAGKTMAEYT